jgi:hypothetical protein
MVTAEFDRPRLGRAEQPPYSPDLSPCNFWPFRFLKKKLKDRQLRIPAANVQKLKDSAADQFIDLQTYHQIFTTDKEICHHNF